MVDGVVGATTAGDPPEHAVSAIKVRTRKRLIINDVLVPSVDT